MTTRKMNGPRARGRGVVQRRARFARASLTRGLVVAYQAWREVEDVHLIQAGWSSFAQSQSRRKSSL